MTLKRIQRLPLFVANQIAAGEVIERPASVVKELLENALDAGATQIHVEIGFGGLNLIKVSDNGSGIVADDLALAIAPHATSKINQLADLYSIQSMGFRGEALASISSIARVAISSKPAEQEHAMTLEGMNQEWALTPSARAQGTTVEVQDIFFNAPVRKKFLKSERGEFQAIEAIVKRFAMSAPHVAISLTHNGKLLWSLTSAHEKETMRSRIGKLLGKKFLETATYIEVLHGEMQLTGWLGDAHYQRSQNDGMWIYLNQRMIKDKLLHHAVKQAYATVLHPGRYPLCLLYLSMSPVDVDVNVHPTKHEVRFQQPRLVHDFIVSQLGKMVVASSQESVEPSPVSAYELEQIVCARPLRNSFESFLPSLQDWTQPISISAPSVMVIDKQFALVLVQEKGAFLADLYAINTYLQTDELNHRPMPWEARQLAVPIYYTDDAQDLNQYVAHQLLLQKLGIELLVMDSHRLKVRSLPINVQQLNISSFLQAVFLLTNPQLREMIALLAQHSARNVSECDEKQVAIVLDHLSTHFDELVGQESLIRALSSSVCQEVFYGC